MEKNVVEYINGKMNEITEICKEFDYDTEILDLEKYKIPTMSILIDKDVKGSDVIVTCNVIPIVIENYSTLFVQFYMCISDIVPDDKVNLINEFIKQQNERFMIGNLLNFENSVCVKYSLYFSASEKIDKDTFARSLDIFIYQANIMVIKIYDLINGNISIDEALDEGSFFYEKMNDM